MKPAEWASRICLAIGGTLALGAGITMNVQFLVTLATVDLQTKIYAALAIVSGLSKIGAPVFRDHTPNAGKGVVALFVCALAFDLACGVGFSAITRGAKVETQSLANQVRRDQGAAVDRLQAELARKEDAARERGYALRSAAELEPALAAAKAKTRNCDRRGYADTCQELYAIQAELENARDREAAAGELKAARDALARLPLARTADPQAAWIADMVESLHIPLPAEYVSRGFGVLIVALIELASVFGIKAALAPIKERVPPVRTAPAPPAARPTASAKPARRGPRRSTTSPSALATWLGGVQPDSDGWMRATQRYVAERTGMSIAEVNRELRRLEAAGAIELKAGRSGTAIKVVGALQ